MNIQLQYISKRFGNSWVFRDINYEFHGGNSYAVTGPNGSGKSTLLKIVSGGLAPSGGQLAFTDNASRPVHWSDSATLMTFTAPYIELIERLTLLEHIHFHFKFRNLSEGMTEASLLAVIEMDRHRNKQVRDFSSGMKQRLKLALSLFTDCPVMLLDEPTSNLDRRWTDWYLGEIHKVIGRRLIIIASNNPEEYAFCQHELSIGGS